METTIKPESSTSRSLNFLEKIKAEIESEKPQKNLNLCSKSTIDPKKSPAKTKKWNKEKSFAKYESKKIEVVTYEDHATACKPDSEKCKQSDQKPKCSQAELKRMESLKARNTARGNQQKLIKIAIQSTKNHSSIPASNKIKFVDSDEEVENETSKGDNNKRKLFDDSDGSDDDGSELFNASKSKLIRTKVSALDERFRMTSKFFDEEDGIVSPDKTHVDEEQNKILEIADSIISKDPRAKLKKRPAKDVQIVLATRFDPLDKKHKSLIVKRDEDIEEPVKKNVKVKKFKVTQDRFYNVSDTLKDQFKNNTNDGFSFLGLFGGKAEEENKTMDEINNENKSSEDKSKKIKRLKNPLLSGAPNFFNVSEESESEEDKSKDQTKKVSKNKKISMYETLFINVNDSRVEEALEFFNSPIPSKLAHVVISSKLRKIVKKKHQRNLAKAKQFKTKLGMRRKFKKVNNEKKRS